MILAGRPRDHSSRSMFDGAQRVAELFRRYSPLLPSRVPSCSVTAASTTVRHHSLIGVPGGTTARSRRLSASLSTTVILLYLPSGRLKRSSGGFAFAPVQHHRLHRVPPPRRASDIYRRHHTSPQASSNEVWPNSGGVGNPEVRPVWSPSGIFATEVKLPSA